MTSSAVVRAAMVVALLLVFALVVLAMRRAWVARARRQRDIPPLPTPSEVRVRWVHPPLPGRYVSSTRAGDWLDRIVVHSMGVPSRAALGIAEDGIWIQRDGERDVFIEGGSLLGARLDRGIAGKVYEQGGLVVVTWRLGETVVDTGFRADSPELHEELVSQIAAAAPQDRSTPPGSPMSTSGGAS